MPAEPLAPAYTTGMNAPVTESARLSPIRTQENASDSPEAFSFGTERAHPDKVLNLSNKQIERAKRLTASEIHEGNAPVGMDGGGYRRPPEIESQPSGKHDSLSRYDHQQPDDHLDEMPFFFESYDVPEAEAPGEEAVDERLQAILDESPEAGWLTVSDQKGERFLSNDGESDPAPEVKSAPELISQPTGLSQTEETQPRSETAQVREEAREASLVLRRAEAELEEEIEASESLDFLLDQNPASNESEEARRDEAEQAENREPIHSPQEEDPIKSRASDLPRPTDSKPTQETGEERLPDSQEQTHLETPEAVESPEEDGSKNFKQESTAETAPEQQAETKKPRPLESVTLATLPPAEQMQAHREELGRLTALYDRRRKERTIPSTGSTEPDTAFRYGEFESEEDLLLAISDQQTALEISKLLTRHQYDLEKFEQEMNGRFPGCRVSLSGLDRWEPGTELAVESRNAQPENITISSLTSRNENNFSRDSQAVQGRLSKEARFAAA